MAKGENAANMHILLIHQAFAALDEPGGTRHHELARFLANRGHRVTVIASPVSYLTGKSRQRKVPWAERQISGDGLTVLRAYAYPALHRSFVHRVFGFLSFMFSSFWIGLGVRDVDLVWGTSPPIFQGVTAWALASLKGVPFLFEVRDLWPAFAMAVGVLRNPILIRASEWLEKFLYKRADRLVVNSPGFMEHVKSRGAGEVKLVPNGADPAMFETGDAGLAWRARHGLEDRYVVLYAGAHGMSNDLGVLLQAAVRLQDLPRVRIVLLGAGKEKKKLMAQAEEMGLQNVMFLPPVAKSEMAEALAGTDACVAILKPIELYKTVYPNKVFDYMAAGRPVVLAIDGVIRAVVEDACAGIFVPPGDPAALADAIRRLVDEPEAGVCMGARGRDYVKAHFDRRRIAANLEALLVAMLSG